MSEKQRSFTELNEDFEALGMTQEHVEILFEVKAGDNVKISYPKFEQGRGLAKVFHGLTGRISDVEKDGSEKMFRVRLDKPVQVPGLGKVTSDLWASRYLKKVK